MMENHHGILHIRISSKFQLQQTNLTFWNKFAPQKILQVKNGKNSTKFQLKLAILIFWTKFDQKQYFQSKTEKVNTTIELWIFELV